MRSAVNFKVRTLLVLFRRVINKHLRMNTSRILKRDASTLWAGKMSTQKKKIDI